MSLSDEHNLVKSGQLPQELQINLRYHNVGAKGALAIADALKSGQAPQGLQIDLGGNEIGDEGALAIADALKSGLAPQGLQIHFEHNQIGDVGARAIATVVAYQNHFKHKEIKVGGISDEIMTQSKQELIAQTKALAHSVSYSVLKGNKNSRLEFNNILPSIMFFADNTNKKLLSKQEKEVLELMGVATRVAICA